MNYNTKVINWLLEGDPSIRWQTLRDIAGANKNTFNIERAKIESEGWGAKLLSLQDENGLWAKGIYTPKWTSTTYTLLLLKRFGLNPNNRQAKKAANILIDKGLYNDGGINFFQSLKNSETCVTGMVLSLASYFKINHEKITSLVDHLLNHQFKDGGWNCQWYRGATHSSFNTTLSVLEALDDFQNFSDYKSTDINISVSKAHEFLFAHRLYKSDKTGKVVSSTFTKFSFPPRWHYDVLRVMDYFQHKKIPFDERMSDGLDLIFKKREKSGKWKLQQKYPGKTFFDMENVGEPSRWNTLRSLRVINFYTRK
ncbi:MAG: hypothetical protein K9J16_09495 [Melioribacteraceae bacterium]|nr:hypothetical protein [Melioribacteraceae bacterium]MCF8355389.1 hypothetical protein [Melioribacteraceae bacterium]MCF8394634.1 hypothetical protein [Melioribacteraceae bacterium]MCF8419631.1 hypothetical protein [Melioribacteraceae bacterium]